jgi:hypothetical protein
MESLNFRMFQKVVEALEDEGESGHLKDYPVFFCNSNSTMELAIYKGSLGSEKLHGLVVRTTVWRPSTGSWHPQLLMFPAIK